MRECASEWKLLEICMKEKKIEKMIYCHQFCVSHVLIFLLVFDHRKNERYFSILFLWDNLLSYQIARRAYRYFYMCLINFSSPEQISSELLWSQSVSSLPSASIVNLLHFHVTWKLQVAYCDLLLSVVVHRASLVNNLCFWLLLLNHWWDWNAIWPQW